jgi:biopolymer transport protein ExbB
MSKRVYCLKRYSVFLGLAVILGLLLQSAGICEENSAGGTTPTTGVTAGPDASGGSKSPSQDQEKEEKGGLSLWKIIKLGGPLMYVLFALSIAMVAMITYFFLAFSPGNIMPPAFLRRIQQIIRDKKNDEARMFCAQNKNVVSHIIRSGLDAVQKGPQGILEAMSSEGSRRASSLWQKISFLSDISVISPMVGLLGTVIGMFQAFMSVSGSGITAGKINPAYLTSGVAQAVITTIAGLIIGILATMAYAYFRGVVQKIVINLEAVCSRYSDMIAEGGK